MAADDRGARWNRGAEYAKTRHSEHEVAEHQGCGNIMLAILLGLLALVVAAMALGG